MRKRHRAIFRAEVFQRDNFTCAFCDHREGLDAHHITDRHEMPNDGYVKENGISLCADHHAKAEIWHASGHKDFFPGMHPNDLYAKIGSSYELAVKKSELLTDD